MIVTKKMLIGFAIIPIIVALIIAIPKISPGEPGSPPASLIRVQLVKEQMKLLTFGVTERLGAIKTETLIIDEKGQAYYNSNVQGENEFQKRFQVNSQNMTRIRGLITETGFLQIPKTQFDVKKEAQEFRRYTLDVNLQNASKDAQWAEESATREFVPPLLILICDTLTKVVEQEGIKSAMPCLEEKLPEEAIR